MARVTLRLHSAVNQDLIRRLLWTYCSRPTYQSSGNEISLQATEFNSIRQGHVPQTYKVISRSDMIAQQKVASRLMQKWVRHLEHKDKPGRPPVMCLICIEEKHLRDKEIMDRVAWTSSYLMRNNLRNIILIGFEKSLENTNYDFERLPHKLSEQVIKHGSHSNVLFGANNPLGAEDSNGDKIILTEEFIDDALFTESVPIFTNLLDSRCKSSTNDSVVSDLMKAAEVLAKHTKPYRMLFVDPGDSLRNQPNVVEIFPKTSSKTRRENQDIEQFSDISKLLSVLSDLNAVSIVSPQDIVEELHKPGKGTFINKSEEVHAYTSFDGIDLDRLENILTSAFGKKLQTNYFDRIRDHVQVVYINENYKAAAIVLRHPTIPISYLDKIAVHQAYQGCGINFALWRQLNKDIPQMFWRSRQTNTLANKWYDEVCQGFWKLNDVWTVYWHGLDEKEMIPKLCTFAANWPVFFEDNR